jgi:hypothetical protein
MSRGSPYFGVTTNEVHQSWLQNVVDRYALSLICEVDKPLYHASLAGHIREYFQDVLEELNQADAVDAEDN